MLEETSAVAALPGDVCVVATAEGLWAERASGMYEGEWSALPTQPKAGESGVPAYSFD